MNEAVEKARQDALAMLTEGAVLKTRVTIGGVRYQIEQVLEDEFYDNSRIDPDTGAYITDRAARVGTIILPLSA